MPSYNQLFKSANLVTYDLSGHIVNNEFDMQWWQTGSNIQFAANQLKSGVSYLPIRRQEQFLQFTGIWAHQHYADMDQFIVNIRNHHLYCITVPNPPPMMLVMVRGGFFGGQAVYNGFVTSCERGDTRFTAQYTKTFNMEMVMPLNEQTAQVTNNGGFVPTADFFSSYPNAPFYAPSTTNASGYGAGWYNITPGTSLISTNPGNQPTGMPNGTAPNPFGRGSGAIHP